MISCPKCESKSVMSADGEAPAWAKAWMKCFSCGKRWDAAGEAPKAEMDDDEEDDKPTPKRSSDDLVKLVMSVAKNHPVMQKKEEKTAMPKCTKNSCEDEAAEDSVQCPHHRDIQRAANAKFQGRALSDNGMTKRKYTKRTTSTDLAVGCPNEDLPITLAEPKIINPARRNDLDGNGLTILDGIIGKLQGDLQVLQAARDVMERMG